MPRRRTKNKDGLLPSITDRDDSDIPENNSDDDDSGSEEKNNYDEYVSGDDSSEDSEDTKGGDDFKLSDSISDLEPQTRNENIFNMQPHLEPPDYSKVAKKKTIYITGNDRVTSDHICQYEYTNLIGVRATQISKNNIVYLDEYPNLTDPIEIATLELKMRKSPILIHRKVDEYIEGDTLYTVYEKWDPNEMRIPTNI